MPEPDVHYDYGPAEVEHRHHDYRGNRIPWYVRLIWIGFWCFAIFYTIRFLFPAVQDEPSLFPGPPDARSGP